MPDFLTRRDGTWHFVRRVPAEFARFDARGIVRHSTKVRIRDDRNGRRASRIADKFNADLEATWRAAALGQADSEMSRYDTTRQYARTLGIEYVENDRLLHLPIEKLLERLETLVGKGVADQPVARAAALGTEIAALSERAAVCRSKAFVLEPVLPCSATGKDARSNHCGAGSVAAAVRRRLRRCVVPVVLTGAVRAAADGSLVFETNSRSGSGGVSKSLLWLSPS